MDLRLLRYFVAVAEERHVGRAAARLHMTQPPLSRAIKQLEAELGTVLLHRSSTGVTLTAAGTVLYDEARTLLEQANQVRARVANAAGTATITIGILADSAEQAGTPSPPPSASVTPTSTSVSAKLTSPTPPQVCGPA
jgi:DNA-binding transcriptional LysR family regulator